MLAPGDEINGYRIERVIGRGGMGIVYEAMQLSLERSVAIKVLPADVSNEQEFRVRFRREAFIQAQFAHAHVVTVHDYGEVGGDPYLVMRLIDGVTLKEMLTDDVVTPDWCIDMLSQVADALDAAHRAGLVHRDVKPQNILVERSHQAYLADFGLTRLVTDTGFTRSGQFVGTVKYIAPEQIRGLPPTPAADIYSLAAVLYECLTGRAPFEKPSDVAVLYAHTHEPPPRPTAARPELPHALDAVIASGMAKEPRDRPPTAAHLIRAARRAVDSAPTLRPSGAASTTASESPRRTPAPGSREPDGHPRQAAAAESTPEPLRGFPASPNMESVGGPGKRSATDVVRRVTGRSRLAAAVAITAFAVAAGVIIARATGGSSPGLRTVASEQVALRYSSPFVETSVLARIPGLSLFSPVILRDPAAGLTIEAGLSKTPDVTLLPATMRSQLSAPVVPNDRVRVAGLEALRYMNLSTRAGGPHLDVFAVPISGGAAIVTCARPARLTAADTSNCGALASTFMLRIAKPLPVAPNPTYAHSITAALATFTDARARAFKLLRSARQSGPQAAALTAFTAPCNQAERSLRAAPAGPQEAVIQSRVTTAVGAICAAYSSAARAARSNQTDRYNVARSAATAAEKQFDAALSSLRAIGYHV